ncbi:hypothetical protein Tco_0644925 [Tanacetum coccineum]
MAALKFASSHNMVVFLDKPTKSDGFEQIVDFLNAHPIKYALTVNPTIYTSCIEQFWATAKVKTVNGEVQIQPLVDKKKVIVTEASIRRDLQLADENGTECLPIATIFAELERMGAKTTAWNEFSSTMASAVILIRDKQVEGISKHKEIYANEQEFKDNQVKESPKPQKISDTPQSHNQEYTTDSHHTPATTQPSTSKPQKKQSRRKQRKDTEDPQLSGPTEPVTDDTENVASVPTHSNDPLLQKKRVEEAGKEKKSKPLWDERLFKIGRSAQVVSFEDEVFYMVRSLQKQDVVEKEVSTAEVATTTTVDELTLAWTLIEIKAAKPKARGVIVQEPNAELEEEEKLARQREEDANIAEWDNVQAMMDADYELAARLQA